MSAQPPRPVTARSEAEDAAAAKRTFRDRLLDREQLVGTFLNSGSAAIAEICAMSGLDWALIDLEHGAGGESDMFAQITALRTGSTAALVRVESPERIRLGRGLDAGADALMLPRCDRVAHIERLLDHLRYPPEGDRGVAGYTRARRYGFDGRAHSDVDEDVAAIVQIESAEALDSAHEIAALPGVAALFVGPSDLTAALGFPGAVDDARFIEAITTVSSACRDAGIAAGILSFDDSTLDRYAELGYTLHAVGADVNVWSRYCRDLAGQLPSTG